MTDCKYAVITDDAGVRGLDEAWAAVEALLRPTDRLIVSTLPGGGVWARVVEVDGHRHSASADADTPQAALSTLAQRLTEAR